jgi:hypothetical protein
LDKFAAEPGFVSCVSKTFFSFHQVEIAFYSTLNSFNMICSPSHTSLFDGLV